MTDTTRITGEVPSGPAADAAGLIDMVLGIVRAQVLHAFAILRNCRSAATGGGRALVVETVIGEIGKPDLATLSDMGMLCVTGGIERDLAEFDTLFSASGWHRGETHPIGGGYYSLELRAR